MRRRGLGDVLHYFIPEEEQRQAREPRRPRGRPARWCLPASPERPLACAIAVDLAVAAVRSSAAKRACILAPFPAEALALRTRDVEWRACELDAFAEELEDLEPEAAVFLAVPPEQLAEALRNLIPGTLEGLLLPVDASSAGPLRALALLRLLPRPMPELRVGATVVGAPETSQARALLAKLQGAARRQLGLEIEDLGELRRDPASFQALLRGVPLLDVDADAASAQSLRALWARLG